MVYFGKLGKLLSNEGLPNNLEKKTKTFQYFSLQGAETEFSSPLFHTYAVEGENYISAPCAYKIEHE